MKIDIPWETVDLIVVASLKESLVSFENDIRANKEGTSQIKVFDLDPKVDLKMLKKHRKACIRLIEWYGGAIE